MNIQPDNFVLVNASPDTFHECMISNEEPCAYPDVTFLDPWLFGVPANGIGCEFPQDGEGYAGIFAFYQNPDPVDGYREYLSVPLSTPLTEGEVYDVSLWASLAERATHAIWNLQVLFTEEPVVQGLQAQPMTNEQPQLNGTLGEYIDIRDGWQELSWEYTAEGGESYLTIGNYELNSQIDTIRVMFGDTENHYFPGTYYYIDNVSVVRQTLSTDQQNEGSFSIFPSPADNVVTIQSTKMISSFQLFSLTGGLIEFSREAFVERKLDISGLKAGMYILTVQFEDGSTSTRKVVKR